MHPPRIQIHLADHNIIIIPVIIAGCKKNFICGIIFTVWILFRLDPIYYYGVNTCGTMIARSLYGTTPHIPPIDEIICVPKDFGVD